jgi:formyl-CoA transferase
MDRMGFGYKALSKINPRIICAFGSGFGQTGPLSHKGGQDILAQALSGVMARKPDQSLPTSLYATALADYSAGMHLVQGILLALMQREKTGRGQQISVSLYDSMLAMQMQEASMWMARKRELNWGAFPLTGVFETTDGALVIVGAFKAESAAGYLPRAGPAGSVANPRRDLRRPVEEQGRAARQFRSKLSTNTTAYWLPRLEEQDLPRPGADCPRRWPPSRPRSTAVVSLPQCGSGRNEPLKLVGSPITMDAAAFRLRHAPPTLGEHATEILGELGYAPDRIAALRTAKVLS